MLKNISKRINNKKGSGELVVVLLLVILGLFFLTKYVFKIPFPFTSGDSTNTTIESQEEQSNSKEEKQGKKN